MRNMVIAALLLTVLAVPAEAAKGSCDAQANGGKLSGAARDNFLKKCEMTSQAASSTCEGQAATRKLSGAARNNFIRHCYEGNQVTVPPNVYCESEASGRKLAGEARSSFVKKCLKDPKAIEKAPAEKPRAEPKPVQRKKKSKQK